MINYDLKVSLWFSKKNNNKIVTLFFYYLNCWFFKSMCGLQFDRKIKQDIKFDPIL